MKFKSILKEYKQEIERNLRDYFNTEIRENKTKAVFFQEVLRVLREYNLRKLNKRLRGILLILAYELFKGKKNAEITKIAQSMELIHSSFLMHDDIIDNDTYRRGGPSLHYFFEKYHQRKFQKGQAKHFGQSLGIMAGDVGFAQAYLSILESKFSDRLKILALKRFHQMYLGTCYGQILDILNSYKEKVNVEDVLEMYKYKTAKYTIETPMHLGAIFASANQKELNIISKFAIPLGVAFQIQDDILGMFGEKKVIGKPVTSDLEEGKQTLLIVSAFKKANIQQKKLLLKYFGQKNIKIKDLNKVREVIIETKALKYCQDYAKILVRKAKKALKTLKKIDKNTLFLLEYLADYIIKRNY